MIAYNNITYIIIVPQELKKTVSLGDFKTLIKLGNLSIALAAVAKSI